MKRTLNKSIRDEKGQALIIVLILMLLGGLITAPLLGFMSTGLIAGQVFEVKMEGLYAADAGIEDACWKLLNGEWDINPTSTLTVNGMEVTVIELAVSADGTIYTLQSTAELAGEPKAEIIAQIMVTVGSVEEGGEGGEYETNEEMAALSLIDEYTIIFTTQNNSIFWGREDDDYGTEIEPCDLASLNMATGKGHLFLDGDDVMTDPKYNINGVHYYQEGGLDYLLISVHDNDKVGTQPFSKSDIIKLEVVVNETNPDAPYISEVKSITLFDTIDENVDIVALSRRNDGTILFSFSDESATLGGNPFDRAEVIEFDGSTYTRLFDADDILPDNPNLVLDCLAVLSESDPRLLLSFDADPVTGNDGEPIKSQDVAIWDPADDTINLHISMCIETWVPGGETTVSIVSWEIS